MKLLCFRSYSLRVNLSKIPRPLATDHVAQSDLGPGHFELRSTLWSVKSAWSAPVFPLVCTGLQLHAPSFLPLQHLWCPSKVTICLCTLAVHLLSLSLSLSAPVSLTLSPKFIFQLHNTNTLIFIWRKWYHTFLIYHLVNLSDSDNF